MNSGRSLEQVVAHSKAHALSYVQSRIEGEILHSKTGIASGSINTILTDIIVQGGKLMWGEFQATEVGKGTKITHPLYAAALKGFLEQSNELSRIAKRSNKDRQVNVQSKAIPAIDDAMDVEEGDDRQVKVDLTPSTGKRKRDAKDTDNEDDNEQEDKKASKASNKRQKVHVKFSPISSAIETPSENGVPSLSTPA
ncbi:hypothetical protein EON65_19710, partial [archaeon]